MGRSPNLPCSKQPVAQSATTRFNPSGNAASTAVPPSSTSPEKLGGQAPRRSLAPVFECWVCPIGLAGGASPLLPCLPLLPSFPSTMRAPPEDCMGIMGRMGGMGIMGRRANRRNCQRLENHTCRWLTPRPHEFLTRQGRRDPAEGLQGQWKGSGVGLSLKSLRSLESLPSSLCPSFFETAGLTPRFRKRGRGCRWG